MPGPTHTYDPSHQIIGIVAGGGVNLISDVWHRQEKIFWYFGGAYHTPVNNNRKMTVLSPQHAT